MKTRLTLYFLCILLLFMYSETIESPEEYTRIIDSNHFSASSDLTSRSYTLDNIIKNKPLVILIKEKVRDISSVFSNITITINSDFIIKQCSLTDTSNLCVTQKPPTSSLNLTFKCELLPCEINWQAYQSTKHPLKDGRIYSLYSMQEQVKQTFPNSNKMHIKIICNNIEINNLKNELKVYSDQKFIILPDKTNLFILFPQFSSKHYIYFELSRKIKQSTDIKIIRNTNSLEIEKTIMEDYLVPKEVTIYSISEKSTKNIHFDFHLYKLSSEHDQDTLQIQIVQENQSGWRKILRKSSITLIINYSNVQFSYVAPDLQADKDSKLFLTLKVDHTILLMDITQKQTQVHDIMGTSFSYFSLEKGEILQYRMIAEPLAQQSDALNLHLSNYEQLTTDMSQCYLSKGCEFKIQAKQAIDGHLYLGVNSGLHKQIIVLDMKDNFSFTRRMANQEKVYIMKQLELNKAYQVVVNSGNVFVYMSTMKQCQVPSQQCYSFIGSLKRHFIFVPKTQDEQKVIFMIKAKDRCQFTLTILPENNQYIKLYDSQPFAYTMDDKENELKFRFQISDELQSDVSFNLVAPVHSLLLMVDNSMVENKQISGLGMSSADGYILMKKQIVSKQFLVIVKKKTAFINQFIHLTLIASTSQKQIRLESGTTYYETLAPYGQSPAQYIFQFDTGYSYTLNFYSHNVQLQQIQIDIDISPTNNWNKQTNENLKQLTIDQPSDMILLSEITYELCLGDGQESCQLYMKLNNKLGMQIDLAITLLSQHEVIELKDGIWQSFAINSVTKSAHYYFEPQIYGQSISIFYKTTNPGLRIKYKIFYGSEQQIDPSIWPFPSQKLLSSELIQFGNFRPINQITISREKLTQCWPSCIILITIVEFTRFGTEGSYSLMASNSIMQLAQNEKIDVVITEKQEKIYIVDLKYAISQSKDIHFNILHSLGETDIFANVYSENKQRIPDEGHSDFNLNKKQIIIKLEKIKEITKSQSMQYDLELYLYIIVVGISNAKLSLDFSFEYQTNKFVRQLSYNSFEEVNLEPNSYKIFYTSIENKFEVKILKEKGFPYISSFQCLNKDLEECIKQMKNTNEEEKGIQMHSKIYTISGIPCLQCLFFLKISAKQDFTSAQIHLQSQESSIQLREGKQVYDFTAQSQANRYILYAVKREETFINIHIIQGKITVRVTDFIDIDIQKTGKDIISFKIKKQSDLKTDQEKEAISETTNSLMTAFGLSNTFTQFHVSIRSVSESSPSIYTISYSSGGRNFDLQDGLISEYQLEPLEPNIFYYSSKERGQAFFTISTVNPQDLNLLVVTFSHCDSDSETIDQTCWKPFQAEKPSIKDRTPSPTTIYTLPAYQNFQFKFIYSGTSPFIVSLGINHNQFMILPFNIEFPFVLTPKKEMVFLTEVSFSGFAHIYIRQCDESNLTFSYTTEYQSFQNDQYTYETSLDQSSRSQFSTKVNPGTLYLKFVSEKDLVMVSVQIKFSEAKIKSDGLVPGDKGSLIYSIVGASSGQLYFSPVICTSEIQEQCSNIKYSILISQSPKYLRRFLVCPTSYLVSNVKAKDYAVEEHQAKSLTLNDKTFIAQFSIPKYISYVGVRATGQNGNNVFYKPIEVATLQGQLYRTNFAYLFIIFGIIVVIMSLVIIVATQKARKGYRRIGEMES